MSDSWRAGRGTAEPAPGARAPRADSRRDEPPVHERAAPGRGILLTLGAVIIGVLLFPSATRAPLAAVSSSSGPRATAAPSATTVPSPGRAVTTTTAPAPAPASVHVLVANATDVTGVAGAVGSFLGSKGFAILSPVNSQAKLSTSQVYATSTGSPAAATEVASALGLPASAVQPAGASAPVATASGTSVVVVLGQDLATRFAHGTPTSTTTSTTAPRR